VKINIVILDAVSRINSDLQITTYFKSEFAINILCLFTDIKPSITFLTIKTQKFRISS